MIITKKFAPIVKKIYEIRDAETLEHIGFFSNAKHFPKGEKIVLVHYLAKDVAFGDKKSAISYYKLMRNSTYIFRDEKEIIGWKK